MTCLLLALVWGGDVYPWGSTTGARAARRRRWCWWAASACGRARADEPLVPLRLFRNGVVSNTSALSFLFGMGLFGAIVFLPLYLQVVRGQSATNSGLLLAPMMLGLVTAAIVCGRLISRTGRYKVFVTGRHGAWPCLARSGMSTMSVATPSLVTTAWMVLLGLGPGMASPVLTLAAQNAVDPTDIGVVTSARPVLPQPRRLDRRGGVRRRPQRPTRRRVAPPPARGRRRSPATPKSCSTAPSASPRSPSRCAGASVLAVAESVTTVFLWAVPVLVLARPAHACCCASSRCASVSAADDGTHTEAEWAASV